MCYIFTPFWVCDRYNALDEATDVDVFVRIMQDDNSVGEWLEIGCVKSENDEYSQSAVSIQRGLIVEVRH